MPASPGCSVRSRSSSCLRGLVAWARCGTGCWAGRSSRRSAGRRADRAAVAISGAGGAWSRWRSARSAAPPASARGASTAPGSRGGSRGPTGRRSAPRRWRTARSCPGPAAASVGSTPQRSGRQVEQVQLAGEEGRLDPRAAASRSCVELRKPARTPSGGQRVDLVLHQRDQRRDDHPDARPDQRRDLVAQRLAAAGRHQHQRVAAADDVVDDLLLLAAEGVVAEDPAEHVEGGVVGRAQGEGHPPILRPPSSGPAHRARRLWTAAKRVINQGRPAEHGMGGSYRGR